jgi:Tol biopolymer transport system component
VFSSNRSGGWDAWRKDLKSGRQHQLTRLGNLILFPVLSPDGAQIAYATEEQSLYVMAVGGAGARKICEKCGQPRSWLPSGKRILSQTMGSRQLLLIDVEDGKLTKLPLHPQAAMYSAHLSPDERFLAFGARFG